MKRGEVYWADLAPRSGFEQQGRRSVVVISHDAFNKTQGRRSINFVPLSTSALRNDDQPVNTNEMILIMCDERHAKV